VIEEDRLDSLVRPKDVYWWLVPKSDTQGIIEALNNDFKLLTDDNDRLQAYQTYSSLYVNHRVDFNAPLIAAYETRWATDDGRYTRIPYNLMKMVIDEAVSRIIKSHPRARFLTDGGTRKHEQKALLMERWNDAEVYRLHQRETMDKVIKDACIYGLGALKVTPATREDKLEASRVFAGNLFVDLQETVFDEPRRLHHRRMVPKSVLKLFFPKFGNEIDSAGTVSDHADYMSWFGQYSLGVQDHVEVIESWHLPSFEGADDGRRYLWINTKVLQAGPYARKHFPFAFFNWKSDPNNTFYGIGLGEDLLGVHLDCNITINRKNTAIEWAAVPHWTYRMGSIKDTDITNMPGTKIPFTGDMAPEYVVPHSVPMDLVMEIREYEQRAYKIAGLAAAQAFGERIPSGLETGRAVENYFNVESVPFVSQLRKFEYFIEDLANVNVAAGRELYERNKKWSVVLETDRDTVEELKWSEVALDPREAAYVIRAAPTSALSELPAARLGEVERLVALLPQTLGTNEQQIMDLLNMPDVRKFLTAATAQKNNGEGMIERALSDGIFTPPSPFMDLPQFIIDATREEQRAEEMGVDEAKVSTLRRMIRRANELEQVKMRAQQMQGQGMITPAASPMTDTGVSPNAIQEPQATNGAMR
jgi:hypothetical protein